ncbi:hypothetical protein EDB86DRAFT_2191858 [Lactarius hatsudake]|nr:hypothetical protein EDB86DRAFT_2191858 [Lactarius hatsudake]
MVGTIRYITAARRHLEFLILENRNQGTREHLFQRPCVKRPQESTRPYQMRAQPNNETLQSAGTRSERVFGSKTRELRSSRKAKKPRAGVLYSPRRCACRRVRFTVRAPHQGRGRGRPDRAAHGGILRGPSGKLLARACARPSTVSRIALAPQHTTTRIQYAIGVLFLFFGVRPTPVTVTTFRNEECSRHYRLSGSALTPFVGFSSPLLAPYFYLPSFLLCNWRQVRLNGLLAASRVPRRSRGLRWAGSVLSTSHRQAALRRASSC